MRTKGRRFRKGLAGILALALILTGSPWMQQDVQAAGGQEESQDTNSNMRASRSGERSMDVWSSIYGTDAKEGTDSTPGILVRSGETLNLTVHGTVTIKGGNGWYFRAGSAGIEVQEGATLNVYGSGTLTVIGGDAGGGGTNTQYKPFLGGTSEKDQWTGGCGGGGAGAGIGGSGGSGGAAMSYYTWEHYFDKMAEKQGLDLDYASVLWGLSLNFASDLKEDGSGGAGGNCGTVNIDSGSVTVLATGGQGGSAGPVDTTVSEYKKGDASAGMGINWGLFFDLNGPLYGGTGQRGTGGGGYPAAGIGGGGGGAGAGGYGGYGGYHAQLKNPEAIGDFALGGGGGGGGGQGYVTGASGIGGLGQSFLRANRPGEGGYGIYGGKGAVGTKSEEHGRYDGMNGHDGGAGGTSGTGGTVSILSGRVQADGTTSDIGAGSGTGNPGVGTLAMSEPALLLADNIQSPISSAAGKKVYSMQFPLPTGASDVSIAGKGAQVKEGYLSYWPANTSYKVRYTDTLGFGYECQAYYSTNMDRIVLENTKRIDPINLTLQYSMLATGYTVEDSNGNTLTDLRPDIAGFQIKNGTKITIKINYADTSYSTTGWSDGTDGPVWSGTMDADKTLTAYTKSTTALTSYTVSLDKADFQQAKFTFTVAYESINEDSQTLILTPVTDSGGLITLKNDADPSITMQIKIPATEVNVRTDPDNTNTNKEAGSYTKVITGEVQNPGSVRAGSYSGSISFHASYGTETRVLDFSKGSITINGDSYTQGSTKTSFHGNYRVTQTGGQNANTLTIGGSGGSGVQPRDFFIKVEKLNTTGDVTLAGTENIALTLAGNKLGAMSFENAKATTVTATGANTLTRTSMANLLTGQDVVTVNNPIPETGKSYFWGKVDAGTTLSEEILPYTMTAAYMSQDYDMTCKYIPINSASVGEENYQGKSYQVAKGVLTAANSQITLNLPEKTDSLTLTSGTENSLQAGGMVLKDSSTLTVNGQGTLSAANGFYGRQEIVDCSAATSVYHSVKNVKVGYFEIAPYSRPSGWFSLYSDNIFDGRMRNETYLTQLASYMCSNSTTKYYLFHELLIRQLMFGLTYVPKDNADAHVRFEEADKHANITDEGNFAIRATLNFKKEWCQYYNNNESDGIYGMYLCEKGSILQDTNNRKTAIPALSLDASSAFVVNGGAISLSQSSYLTKGVECKSPLAGTATVKSVPELSTPALEKGVTGGYLYYAVDGIYSKYDYTAINATPKPESSAETGGTVTLNGGNLALTLNGAANSDINASVTKKGGTINGN